MGVFGGIIGSFIFKGAGIYRYKIAVTSAGGFAMLSLIYFGIALQVA
jgi:hypothetical protein